MADVTEGTTSLHDQLTASFEAVEAQQTAPVETPQATETAVPEGETAEQKAERLRDEKGRFAPGKAEAPKVEAKAPEVPVAPARPARPSSWKKDYWEHWDKLDPKLAAYIHQREQEYAQGVSTYKSEADHAKPLVEAIAPFLSDMQRHNVQPAQLVGTLLNAHRTLALGSPQQKLQMFQKLANDYGVPLQAPQGNDDLRHFNPVYERISQLEGQLHSWQNQQQQQQQQQIQSEIEKFAASHPHYEQVRGTMAGLLQSNLAEDLTQAYDKAIRMHDDIWEKEVEAKAKADLAKKAEQARNAVKEARANTVSVRSSTPSGAANQSSAKGVRALLEEALEDHAGRV